SGGGGRCQETPPSTRRLWHRCHRGLRTGLPSGKAPCPRKKGGVCRQAQTRETRTRPSLPPPVQIHEDCCRSRTRHFLVAAVQAGNEHAAPYSSMRASYTPPDHFVAR